MSESQICANHPNVETYLRCNKCGKPICVKCAIRTPVGYRCRECVRKQQKVFYGGFRNTDYLIAAAVALPLSLVAGWLIPSLGWFAIILGPVGGTAIAQAVRWAIRRRRGRYTWLVVCVCVVVGVLPKLVGFALSLLLLPRLAADPSVGGGSGALSYTISGALMGLLWVIVYLVTAVGSVFGWLRTGRRI